MTEQSREDAQAVALKRAVLVERRRCLEIVLEVCNRKEALAKTAGNDEQQRIYEIESQVLGEVAEEMMKI